MALPEIADAEGDAARRARRRTRGRSRGGPAPLSSHAWPSAVRLRMVKEFAFGCNSVQSPKAGMYCSRFVGHGRDGGHGAARRSAPRARGLPGSRRRPVRPRTASANKPSLLADETHVPVVERVGQRRREAQADAADEILRLVAVEHDGVQHAQRIAAGVEIEAQREGQPARALPLRMFAFDPDDRAHRAALLDGDFLQQRSRNFPGVTCASSADARAILAQQHQLAVAQRFAAAARDRVDDVRAAAREAAHELAGVDFDRRRRFPSRVTLADRLRGAALRDHFEGSVAGASPRRQRMRGPLERTVRPVGQRPALQRLQLAGPRRAARNSSLRVVCRAATACPR